MLHLENLLELRSSKVTERIQRTDLEINHWTSLACDHPKEFQQCLRNLVSHIYPSEKKFALDDVLIAWLEEHPEATEDILACLIQSLSSSKRIYSQRLAPFYRLLARMQEPHITYGWTDCVIQILQFLFKERDNPVLSPLAGDLMKLAPISIWINVLESSFWISNMIPDVSDPEDPDYSSCIFFVYSLYAPEKFDVTFLSNILVQHTDLHGDICTRTFQFLMEKEHMNPSQLLTHLIYCKRLLSEISTQTQSMKNCLWMMLECLLLSYFMMAGKKDCQLVLVGLPNIGESDVSFNSHIIHIIEQLPKKRREMLRKEFESLRKNSKDN
jgi:hypothetical protein